MVTTSIIVINVILNCQNLFTVLKSQVKLENTLKMFKITLLILFLTTLCTARRVRRLHSSIFVTDYTVPKCDRINEYFACGSPCQNTCKKLREPCEIKTILCQDSCYCLPGFARDDRVSENNITCIPEWQCDNPRGRCLGEKEFYQSNGSPCQKTCARLDLPCPIFDKVEVPGCFCQSGFARDEHGVCIRQENCSPGRCSGLNEGYKTVNCPEICANIRGCNPDYDIETRCACDTGFVRLSEDGNCVPEPFCYNVKT